MVAAALNLFGTTVSIIAWRHLHSPLLLPLQLTSLAVSASVLVAMWRRRVSVRMAPWVFAVHQVPIAVFLWVADSSLGALGRPWVGFEASRLGALTAVLIAPELLSGLFGVLTMSGVACLHYFLLPAEARANLIGNEPWPTVAYGGFAVGLLIYRARALRLEAQIRAARTEAATLERLGRIFVALRDLASTPIQTLAITCGTLRQRFPESSVQVDRIERAVDRLTQLNQVLQHHARGVPWRAPMVGFDPLDVIRNETPEPRWRSPTDASTGSRRSRCHR